jgi:hypothetical protein
MDTQLDEIHGALKRTRQLIVGGAPLEQTVASRDEAMAELVEIMEFLDQHESDSGRFD